MRNNLVLFILLMMAGFIKTSSAQDDRWWIVKEIVGQWEYRAAPDKKPVTLDGNYDVLRPEGSVRLVKCAREIKDGVQEPGKSTPPKCAIKVLKDRSGATKDLSLPGQPAGWLLLKKLPPIEEPLIRPLPAPPEYQEKTRPGGSRDVTACGGSLPLQAPVCGETVDINDFRIRWSMPETAGKTVSVILEKADGSPAMVRKTVEAVKGEYSDSSLREFFAQIQDPTEPVSVVLRVAGQSGAAGIRLIQVPSVAQSQKAQNRFREFEGTDALVGTVDRMIIAMEEGMWSRAGEEARRLLQLAPNEPELHRYALAGACRSGFDNLKAQLRLSLTAETYSSICGRSEPNAGLSASDPVRAVPTEPRTDFAASHTRRLGVALLIGNSSYWNVPLNSVENDVQNLSQVLEAIGFEVVIRKNLKEAKDFRDALESVVKEKAAGPDDVLLVYYSGHGLEIEGKSYLLGTGLRVSDRYGDEIRGHAQSAEELIALMERKDPSSRVLIVEACRNDLMVSETGAEAKTKKSGFAFNRAGVPNTYVMFANRPGLPTPARSEYGLMGPFTEAFIEALRVTSGEIRDVFAEAKKNTTRISPGQEPMMETSDKTEELLMRPKTADLLADRAAALLNSAEPLYMSRDWRPYLATMERARALSVSGVLQERLDHEIEFARNVMAAEEELSAGQWQKAAEEWRKAAGLFPARCWVSLNAAVALALCNRLEDAVLILAKLSGGSETAVTKQSSVLLKELLAEMPELGKVAPASAEQPAPMIADEFEKVTAKE